MKPAQTPRLIALCLGAALGAQVGVFNINPSQGTLRGSDPELAAFDSTLYVAGANGQHRTLLRFDPVNRVLLPIVEASTALPLDQVEDLEVVGPRLFFRAAVPGGGLKVWVHDPSQGLTAAATTTFATNPLHLTSVGNQLFFSCRLVTGDRELWVTDGTQAGTSLVRNIHTSGEANPNRLTRFGSLLVFEATDGTHANEPWSSDGTLAGTRLLLDVDTSGSSEPAEFTVSGGFCYFSANDGGNDRDLWRTDGTTTTRIPIGIASDPDPTGLVDLGGTLYFAASGGIDTGRELWRTVGTTGVQQVIDLRTGAGLGSGPAGLTAAGGALYFSAFRASSEGRELFAFDPSSPITAGTNPRALTQLPGSGDGVRLDAKIGPMGNGGVVAFAGTNGSTGYEPWTTSGAGSPRLLADLAQPGNSDPDQFTVVGDDLFFAATDNALLGRELFFVPLGGTGTAVWLSLPGGCARSNGVVPSMALSAPPRLGTTVQLLVDGAAPGGLVVPGFAARPGWQPAGPCTLRLGNSLGAIGSMPWLFADTAGHAQLALVIPTTGVFLGQRVVFQALVVDPGGPFAGLGELTNAIDAFLGT